VLVDQVIARPASWLLPASSVCAVSVVVWPTVTVAVGGVTVTVATGAAVTVTVAVPLFPSLEAVIVTLPVLRALTRPELDTTAMVSSLEVHPTSRPGNSAPDASRTLAESCTAPPTATLAVGGVTTTVSTGTCRTVTEAEPITPSTFAKMTAIPGDSAVTTPVLDTEATDGAPLDHDAGRPDSDWPFSACASTLNCTVCPVTTLGAAGETMTRATGIGVTVMVAVPVFPSLVAVIVADPALTPVTSPLAETVATDGDPDVKAIGRPARTLP